MTTTNEKLPVFVYGTLKEGFHNYKRLLEHETTSIKKAKLLNHNMYSAGYYPAILPGDGVVVGELMNIKRFMYDTTLARLDTLEGFMEFNHKNSMYIREKKMVVLENGETVEAYVYIWNRRAPGELIESGDWQKMY